MREQRQVREGMRTVADVEEADGDDATVRLSSGGGHCNSGSNQLSASENFNPLWIKQMDPLPSSPVTYTVKVKATLEKMSFIFNLYKIIISNGERQCNW